MNAENRVERRAQSRTRGRKAAGLSILALTGLVSAYAQVLRSPSAYATTSCTVTVGTDTGSGATGSAGDLRSCITEVNNNGGGSITFSVPSVTLTSALPDLTESLSIAGGAAGVTVNGGGSASNFRMLKTTGFTGKGLAVSNLTLSGFTAKSRQAGGVLYLKDGAGSVALDNVTMSSNYAAGKGGAIYDRSGSTFAITNSSFTDNYGKSGGAAYFAGAQPITITDTSFSGNKAFYTTSRTYNGGAITFYNSSIVATITRSSFDSNLASGNGAAIYDKSVSSLSIVDSTFTGNISRKGNGAAVALESWSSASIFGSTFSGNRSKGASEAGGIVYFGADSSPAVLATTSMTGNTVAAQGTLYSLANNLVVTNVFIGGNTATTGHAAIYSKQDLEVNFSTIADNDGTGTGDVAVKGSTDSEDPAVLTLNGTVIQAGSSGLACEFPGDGFHTVLDQYTVATDRTCGLTGDGSIPVKSRPEVPDATIASIDLGSSLPYTRNGVAQSYRLPGSASILRSGAPSTNLGVSNVSPDQLGTTRSGTFVIGSIQNAPVGPTPPPVPAPVPDSGGSDASPTPTSTPSASAPAKVDPLDPIVTSQNPFMPAGGLPAGKGLMMSNGQPVPLTITPLENRNGPPLSLVVSAPGLVPPLNMTLAGRGDEADPLGLTSKQALILQSEAVQRSLRAKTVKVQPVAVSTGDGFQASSPVKFYILPSTYLGSLITDASGAYKGALKIPAGILPGVYTLQANGLAPDGAVRSLSIGVLVKTTRVAVKTVSEKASVYFDSLSPDLTPAGKTALRALVKKTGKQASTVRCVGYVQPTGGTGNDDSLSQARAGNVAAYLRSLGLKGAYAVAGDGRDKTSGGKARRVDVTINYAKG